MVAVENDDSGARRGAGQSPALKAISEADEAGSEKGEVTPEEQKEAGQFVRKRGRRAALRFIAALALVLGIGVGYSDGDDSNDVGCTVAQHTEGAPHDARSVQAEKDAKGKRPRSEGIPAGPSPGGNKATVCGPDCTLRTEVEFCPKLERPCAYLLGVRSGPGWQPPRARFVFRKAGSRWDVVFEGSDVFHVDDILGSRYLNHFLHDPNGVISSYDLEVKIRPEKAARSRNSIQEKLDPETVRSYLRELTRLRREREEATERGEPAEVDRLDGEIGAPEEALHGGGVTGDAGERARGNVRKAVGVVLRHLAKGGPAEQAFAQHIEQFVSLGYECVYNQPEGRVWE